MLYVMRLANVNLVGGVIIHSKIVFVLYVYMAATVYIDLINLNVLSFEYHNLMTTCTT